MPIGGSPDPLVAGTPTVKRNGLPLSDVMASSLITVEVDLDSIRPSMVVLRFFMTLGPGDDPGVAWAIGDDLVVVEEDSSKTLFKGEVVNVEAEYGGGGQQLIVRGLDKSHRLHRARKYRIFTNQTDSDIASTIAGDAGISADVGATNNVHDFIAQVNQTDWEFLRWRAEENGLMLDVADGDLVFKKRSAAGPGAFSFSVNDLIAFRPRISAPPVSTVTVNSWDMKTKAAFTATSPVSSSDAASLKDTPGGLAGKFGSVTHVSARRTSETQGDVTAVADALAARFADSFVDAEAVCFGNPGLLPGLKVTVSDAGDQFNGDYLISSAKHSFGGENRYTTLMRFTGLEDRSLLGMTNGSHPVATRVPRIEGLVTGIVTNVGDPDEHMRVKVKFPWLDDSVESDWMRTVHFGAGPKHGAAFLPEVNDEVVVGFEQGDFRRGYVLGGVYNGQDKPDEDGLGTILSNKTPARRGYSSTKNHRLIFDDEVDGKSGIHLLTGDKQLEIYLDKQNTKITIDSKNGKVEIHGAQDVSVKSDANIAIEATGTLSMKGTGGVTIESSASGSFKATGAMDVEGASTTVKGSGTLDLESSGIATLKGTMVKIN